MTSAVTALLLSVSCLLVPAAFAPSPLAEILVLPALAAVVVLTLRSFRIEVAVGPDGVRVRNYWRSLAVAWPDLREVRAEWKSAVWSLGTARVLAFETRSERSAIAAQAMMWAGKEEAKKLVDALRVYLEPHGVEARGLEEFS